MQAQEQEHDRSEPASPFKLAEARKRGEVAKSLDFNSMIVVGGLLLALMAWGESQWRRLCQLSAQLFAGAAERELDATGAASLTSTLASDALLVVLPFAAAGALLTILATLIQTGPILSGSPIKPQWQRLNPVAGLKRIFNKRALFEAFKSVLKLIGFAAVAYVFFRSVWPSLQGGASDSIAGQLQWLGDSALSLLLRLALVLVIIGLLDLAFVRWSYGRQMRMSRREVKEEIKRREGDPQIRAKLRELQRQNAKQARSMQRVAEADVLITNPQHLAVALRYDRERVNAPIVVAKGAGSWAAEMRALAARHGVSRFENRRLARLLFRRAQIDQAIPPESFLDVARIYAEVRSRQRSEAQYEVAR
jgi:flagellar biosynthetic protein FlhB